MTDQDDGRGARVRRALLRLGLRLVDAAAGAVAARLLLEVLPL